MTSTRRRLVVLLVLCCSVAVLTPVGTAGVSSVSAQRGVVATVAPDTDAYLGVTREVVTGTDGGNTLRVDVTNRVPGEAELRVEVTLVGAETAVESRDVGDGATASFRFVNVSCGATLHVVALGSNTRIELDRPVPCHAAT